MQLSERYKYYKRFCGQIKSNEWTVDKYDMSSYSINGENTAHCIVNSRTGDKLWIANSFLSFNDYNYSRSYDLITIDGFGVFKLAAWLRAHKVISLAKAHNIKIANLKSGREARQQEAALNRLF